MVERWSPKPEVVSSNLTRRAKIKITNFNQFNLKTMFTLHLRKDAELATDVTIVADCIPSENCIVFAAARCGEGDAFNKKLGRRIAEGRLLKYMQSDRSKIKPGIFVIESGDFSADSYYTKARDIGKKIANDRSFSGKIYQGKKR